MLSDRCVRCGLRITALRRRDLFRKYDKHVVDEHGLPRHAREMVK